MMRLRVLLGAVFLLVSVFISGVIWDSVASDAPLSAMDVIPSTALVMVTSPSCPWCDAFEAEVGVLYGKTTEAETYPLHRVDHLTRFGGVLEGLVPASMTPTFIVLKDGRERGRIIGYPGDEMFWWRFSEFNR